MSEVRHVAVVVPARDEEDVLAACLTAVGRAVDRLVLACPEVGVEVVVVLDRCLDASAAVAGSFPVTVRHVTAGSVGAARRAGVTAALRSARRRGVPDRATWVANTDADCAVPGSWLEEQVGLARAGVDLVVGTVEPAGPVDPGLLAAWHARHELRDGHVHVHGANLGVRANAYVAAGGFLPVPLHEDVVLVDRVRASGRPWVATDRTRVRTSPRLAGRVDGGFASFLGALATRPDAVPDARAG